MFLKSLNELYIDTHQFKTIQQLFKIPLYSQVVTAAEMEEIKTMGSAEKWMKQRGYVASKNFSEMFSDFLEYIHDTIHGKDEEDEEDD